MRTRPHTLRQISNTKQTLASIKLGFNDKKKKLYGTQNTYTLPTQTHAYTNRPTQLYTNVTFVNFADSETSGAQDDYTAVFANTAETNSNRDKSGNCTAHVCCDSVPDMLLLPNVAATQEHLFQNS